MRLLLFTLFVFCALTVISAKKQIEENLDPIEGETKAHASKKYTKDSQKSTHHHGHKHKKHTDTQEKVKEADLKPKSAPIDIPEPEIKLQSDLETSKKAIETQKQKDQTEDLHLQDLTYEENLKKDKKKKKAHHGAHQAEVLEKHQEKKLFSEQEGKGAIEEKVIEDSFEPLKETRADSERKNKGKDKKSKDKSKSKKAHEKNKDKGKKSKDGKKKNKDKKNKSKDKKW